MLSRLHLKVGTKIAGGFAIVLLLTLVLSAVGALMLRTVNREVVNLSVDLLPSVQHIGKLGTALSDLKRFELAYALATTAAAKQEWKSSIETTRSTMTTELAALDPLLPAEGEDRIDFNDFKKSLDGYYSAHDSFISLIDQNRVADAVAYLESQGKAAFSEAEADIEKLLTLHDEESQADAAIAAATYKESLLLSVTISVVAFLLGLALALIISRAISKPVVATAQTALRLAEGDLTVDELKVDTGDEIADMAHSFNTMLHNLRELLTEINHSAQQVASTSEELSATSNQVGQAVGQVTSAVTGIAGGATEQSRSLSETASGVGQLKQVIDQIAHGAQEQARATNSASMDVQKMAEAVARIAQTAEALKASAQTTADSAVSGGRTVKDAVEGMEQIKKAVFETAERIRVLGENSAQIGQIVQVIDEIAGQTNLLALNAAIEAARAGEAGKGFAVVAEEVRKLAERSSRATREIGDLIGNMQHGTESAVKAMEVGTGDVERGVELAGKAGEALDLIYSTVDETVSRITGIVEAAAQASTSSSEVVKSVDKVAAVTEENTAATEQMAASSAQVADAVAKAAAVSQQNAAASEEVSASTEEMNASVEEIVASAQSLAEMASRMQGLVNRFKL